MPRVLAVLVAAAVALAVAAGPAQAKHAAAPIPGPCAAMYWNKGYADECRAYLRNALEGDVMSRNLRNCLINAGITTGFVAVGGVIGGVAARAIAGGIVGAGGTACVAAIRGG